MIQTCSNHPERPGRAVCMDCRKTVCLECSTQWDGVNYCVACLKKKRESHSERGSFLAWAAMLLAIVALTAIVSVATVWSGTLLTRMFSSG